MRNPVKVDGNFYIFKCPHCMSYIVVQKNEVKCQIFRHGVKKNDYKQINPHEKKQKCDNLYNENKIYGCGKPFRFFFNNLENYVEECGYI